MVLLIECDIDKEEEDEDSVELLALLSSLAFHPVAELFVVVSPPSQLVPKPFAALQLLASAPVALFSHAFAAVQTSSLSLLSSAVVALGDPDMGVAAVCCRVVDVAMPASAQIVVRATALGIARARSALFPSSAG